LGYQGLVAFGIVAHREVEDALGGFAPPDRLIGSLGGFSAEQERFMPR
jgi:hypothetical protein